MLRKKLLWEVLVPATDNDGKKIRIPYHRMWDRMVREISGGLTIFHSARGNWISPDDGKLFVEKMIPVRIACTSLQIRLIADLVAAHYRQKAVMYYLVSPEVHTIHYALSD